MPAPQVIATPQPRSVPARRTANVSLPTRVVVAQPRVSTAAWTRASSSGKSTPASITCAKSARRPSRPAVSTSCCSTSRHPSSPRWCGELSGPRACAISAPSSSTQRDDRSSSCRRRPRGSREHLGGHSLEQLLGDRVLRDQRVREQRLLHVDDIATERRAQARAARRPRRAARGRAAPARAAAASSGSAPDAVTRAGTSTTSSAASPASVPAFRTSTSCTAPSPETRRRDETERGLAVERAAALLEQRGLLDQVRVAVELAAAHARSRQRPGRAARRRAARAAPRRARRSSGGSTTAPRRARRGGDAAARARLRARRPASASRRGSTSSPSRSTRRTHVRWLSPTWSTTTRCGSTPSHAPSGAGSRSRRCRGRSPGGRGRAARA